MKYVILSLVLLSNHASADVLWGSKNKVCEFKCTSGSTSCIGGGNGAAVATSASDCATKAEADCKSKGCGAPIIKYTEGTKTGVNLNQGI